MEFYKSKKSRFWNGHALLFGLSLCASLRKNESGGVLLFYPQGKKKLDIEQENLLDTVIYNLAIALEREIFESKANQTALLQESEQLHQIILNSVSHEMRTPLTSIIGASICSKR